MSTQLREKPAHIPADLVRDFDFNRVPGAETDVYAAWKRLQGEPAIFWTPHYGGHWVLTRAAEIEAVQRDHERYSHEVMSLPRDSKPLKTVPIQYDPPEHTLYRQLLNFAFSPKVVHDLEPGIRAWCQELIERFFARGECEFVEDFAKEFPIGIFLRLIDLPLDQREHFLQWAEASVRNPDGAARKAAYAKIAEYMKEVIAQRKANPGSDVISALTQGKINGEPIRDEPLLGMGVLLFVGGLDTVAGMLGFITWFLATHPEHRQQLIDDPKLIPGAVEELLRRHGMSNTVRLVTQDTELHGVQLKQGDLVMVPISLHGLDETRWPNASDVDFSRSDARQHDTFGMGPHKCAGAHLARSEIRIFLEEWLKKIPQFEVKPGDTVKTATGNVNGITHLPLVWPKP